jgi:hypothetical protein
MATLILINLLLIGILAYREIKYSKKQYPYYVIKGGDCHDNHDCLVYAFEPDSQPNFLTVELCDGSLESMVINKEIKLCVKRIIYVSSEITVREVGGC